MPAWNPNLRSKSAIRTSDTRHFVDPSIAAAALGIGPAGLIKDLETFGLLFESMCVRDFRVYADALDGDVFHFRDRTGLECDAVLHLRDGRYGLIEVKLGGNRLIEEGAANLIKLADKIDTTTMSKPSFLMVATGTGEYSFTRRDGVMVAPSERLDHSIARGETTVLPKSGVSIDARRDFGRTVVFQGICRVHEQTSCIDHINTLI